MAALAIAVVLTSAGAWAGGRDQDRAPAPSRQRVPDNGSVTPAARKSYEDFWKRLPKSKAERPDAVHRKDDDLSRVMDRAGRPSRDGTACAWERGVTGAA